MNVELVSLTKSCIKGHENLTPEELIVYIARVSNPSNKLNMGTAPKLINYLIENKHWSPFEQVDMGIEIVTSRGIAAQILRHRSFCFQEFSQRYSKVSEFEPIELRYQAKSNRQSSEQVVSDDKLNLYNKRISDVIEMSNNLYCDMLDDGIAKECSRFILPLTTQTTIYMKGSIRSWIHYLQIRCDHHTQLEHRLIAEEIMRIFKGNFPSISEALNL